MSVSPNDFLVQAQALAVVGEEIDSRSSMSRAYYAAYHVATDTAERLELPEAGRRDIGSHEQLIGRFEAQGKALKK